MIFNVVGRASLRVFDQVGGIFLLLVRSIQWTFRPPFRLDLLIRQMEFVGVQSTFIIGLTSLFTGMAFTLQGYYGFRIFGGEDFLGASMVLALTRELSPVLAAILVTGRAGSAMCAELGSMRVSEQIDALFTMAVNPVQYLVVPRCAPHPFRSSCHIKPFIATDQRQNETKDSRLHHPFPDITGIDHTDDLVKEGLRTHTNNLHRHPVASEGP